MREAEFDIVAPAAGAMIESFRAYGYSPATAVADLIDNSITANAKNIWVNFHWDGDNSSVSITDDGYGMDGNSLISAMRPGSRSPLEERSPKDLGRFGMGLKTASFSQCRRLTVAAKDKGGSICIRCWDIDHVYATNEWRLLKGIGSGSAFKPGYLDSLQSGTIVFWEAMDRMLGVGNKTDKPSDQSRFHKIIDEVKEYLSMVFHNYLEGIHPAVRLYINGESQNHRIRPWNPFCEIHKATYRYPAEVISRESHKVSICGFVLPHKDKLTPTEYEDFAGPGGWNARQGIYVYRNNRLLVAGGWLGLGLEKPWIQEEQYKLARIRVDITNAQDFDWLIDIKKASAKPPSWIRGRLTDLADRVRKQAREVFVHRGNYGLRVNRGEISRIWLPPGSNGKMSYKIDRSHYLFKAVENLMLTPANKMVLNALVRTVEETVPVARIWLDIAEKPENHLRPFESAVEADVRQMLSISYNLLRKKGLTHEASINELARQEAYQDYFDLISSINEGE